MFQNQKEKRGNMERRIGGGGSEKTHTHLFCFQIIFFVPPEIGHFINTGQQPIELAFHLLKTS